MVVKEHHDSKSDRDDLSSVKKSLFGITTNRRKSALRVKREGLLLIFYLGKDAIEGNSLIIFYR